MVGLSLNGILTVTLVEYKLLYVTHMILCGCYRLQVVQDSGMKEEMSLFGT